MIGSPTANDRYVVGPIRSAREHVLLATRSLRRALDESDLLTDPGQRACIERLIPGLGAYAQLLTTLIEQIRADRS